MAIRIVHKRPELLSIFHSGLQHSQYSALEYYIRSKDQVLGYVHSIIQLAIPHRGRLNQTMRQVEPRIKSFRNPITTILFQFPIALALKLSNTHTDCRTEGHTKNGTRPRQPPKRK